MARMRCGPEAPVSWKLNFPALSALVVAATFMPLEKSMRRTSSPAAGWLVVPLVTVPVRVWAAAEARASARMAASNAGCASLVKNNSFDQAEQWKLANSSQFPFSGYFICPIQFGTRERSGLLVPNSWRTSARLPSGFRKNSMYSSWPGRLHHLPRGRLQPCDLGHDRSRFLFERCAHRLIIHGRDLAGLVFEIQVAQVLVDRFLACAEIAEARHLFSGIDLAGKEKNVVETCEGENGADEKGHWQVSSRRTSLSGRGFSRTGVSAPHLPHLIITGRSPCEPSVETRQARFRSGWKCHRPERVRDNSSRSALCGPRRRCRAPGPRRA